MDHPDNAKVPDKHRAHPNYGGLRSGVQPSMRGEVPRADNASPLDMITKRLALCDDRIRVLNGQLETVADRLFGQVEERLERERGVEMAANTHSGDIVAMQAGLDRVEYMLSVLDSTVARYRELAHGNS